MKTDRFFLREVCWALAVSLGCFGMASVAAGQTQETPANHAASPGKFPAPKGHAPNATSQNSGAEPDSDAADNPADKQGESEKDGPEAIRKRDEWFYKQRASVNGHIPAGARLKALQHMQRRMVAEGKLVVRTDGTYAAATPQIGSTSFPAWTSVGPTPTTGGTFSPVTGRVTTIAVDPSDTSGNTVLIGGAQGGIWRSTDAGVTWTAVGDQNPSLSMGSIAFAPSNPAMVYAGTGEQAGIGFDIYYGAGVLKSADHGQTWTQTCTVAGPTCPFIGPYNDATPFGFFTLGGTRISYVAVNPTNPQLILVAAQTQYAEGTSEGLYCSSNGGTTWSNILPDEMATYVGFASSSVAFVAFGNPYGSSPGAPHGNGIYKSANATSCAATFAALAGGLPPQSQMGRVDLGISPNFASDGTAYASIANATNYSATNLGVWMTTNGGTAWTQTAAPDVCKQQCWYDNVIKVDPANKNVAYFGGSSVTDASGNPGWVVRTTTGGTNWSTVIPNQLGAGLPHVDTHALAFFRLSTGKVRMYLGNDGGIWRTDDAEASNVNWTNLNGSTLTLTQFYPYISINTSSPSIAFGGTQDNGSQNYQGGASWVDNRQCGDGGSTAVDAVVPSTVYIGCATGYPVNASYQNGALGTFNPAVNGINPADSSSFIPPLAVDPNSANVVYFGTTKVYQSVDAANTWTALGYDLVDGSYYYLSALAIAPGNSSVLYAGGDGGQVFVSTDVAAGTADFRQIGQSVLPQRAVSSIAIDPADKTGGTTYVAYSGFSFVNSSLGVSDPAGHIFKTIDGGNTWTDVSCSVTAPGNCSTPAATDLPNIPVNDVAVDPDVPGTIYAATDLGVYVGDCTVTPCVWSTLGTNLPRVAVLSLRLHDASRTLRAATHGRGVWDIALNNFAFTGPRIFSLTPTSANAGAGGGVTLTVTGVGLTGGTILFGSTALASTGNASDSSLSGTVPAALLTAGSVQVTVAIGNPNPTETSNALPFGVLAATPTLTGCTSSIPAATSAACGTPVQLNTPTNIQLTLTGTNFAPSSKMLFNGSSSGITTHYNSSTSLTATLPGSNLCCAGSTDDLTVLNLPPGGGSSQKLTFQVVAPPPANDNIANAINITALAFGDFEDTSGATTEGTDPLPPCVFQYGAGQGNTGGHANGAYNTIWYKFTPSFSANLAVDTFNSSYDTVLSIWTGAAGSLTNVACSDDVNPGTQIQSQLPSVALTAGTTYYIMVSSYGPPDPNPIALGGKSLFDFYYNFGEYPAPSLTTISPTSTNSGGPDVVLTVNGSGFLSGATVYFDNLQEYATTALATTVVSQTQVTATIPAALFVLPGPYNVYAQNQQPTNSYSNSVPFTVNVGTYPVPSLSYISPTTIVAGSFGLTLSAGGSNFVNGAVVQFNGVPMPTTFEGASELTAAIPASAVASAGTESVTVSNPAPGGGVSGAVPFTITAPTVVPTITSISPAGVAQGSGTTQITINGTNFQQNASVYLSGPNYNYYAGTNFVNSTQLLLSFSVGNASPGTIVSLTVADPAPAGYSNSVNITITGPPDFAFNVAAGQGSQTVSAGQTATYANVITLSSLNGFAGTVSARCAIPAQATTCSVTPTTLTGGQSANVVVTTTARGMALPLLSNRRMISGPRPIPLLVIMLLCLLWMRFARTRRQQLIGSLPLAGLLLFLVFQSVGCGGGPSQAPPPPPPTGTTAGSYTITVTGTSGNTTHTATLQLTVN